MVQNGCDVLQDMKSRFETSTELFNISSRVVADKAVAANILGAKQTRKDTSEKFVKECLVKGVDEFFDPIMKNNLKSFGMMAKQVKAKLKNREISVKADRSLCKTHCDGTKSQLQHARCAVIFPGTFTMVDCSSRQILVKKNKPKLLEFLEKKCLLWIL